MSVFVPFVVFASVSATTAPVYAVYEESYCGLYCMHAALHSLGKPASFSEIAQSKYLSSVNGSTATDLIAIAEHYGVPSKFCTRLSVADLKLATTPILLHTSTAVQTVGFHHWILFLGFNGDSINVYDPPRGRYTMSQAELLCHWDNVGVTVGMPAVFCPRFAGLLFDSGCAVLLVLCLRASLAARSSFLRQRPAVVLVLTAAIAATVWHTLVSYGFVRNLAVLLPIHRTYDDSPIPMVTIERLKSMLDTKPVTVIDARGRGAYRRQHIHGAVNIPISATHGEMRDAVSRIPEGQPIVVYCQSEQCAWAATVAKHLSTRCNGDFFVLRGGMRAWLDSAEDPE